MKIKVIYIGLDAKYWDKLKERFNDVYSELDFEFQSITPTEKFNALDTFKELYWSKPQILYIDFSYLVEEMILLAKWLCRNNEMRLISLVGLYDNKDGFETISRAVSASVRLHHIKSNEIQDVVYDPISLLDVNLAQMPHYVRSSELDQFELWLPLRLSYVDHDHFHIETNSYLELGKIVEIDSHPLVDIMPSRKVFVEKFHDRNLYYNRRFAYDLEFVYRDNDFFSATNKDWKLYKQIKNNPEEVNHLSLSKLKKAEILDEIEKRKKYSAQINESIDEWMKSNLGKIEPKKLKVMIIDETLEVLDDLHGKIRNFPYSLNIQTELLNDCYQVQRTMPHLIVVKMGKINNKKMIENIFKKIEQISRYKPYVFLFSPEEDSLFWQNLFNYKQVMGTAEKFDLEKLKKLARALDEKVKISQTTSKVFFNAADERSTIYLKREAKILGMTESVLYFESKLEVPMWTVFLVKKPVRMLLTVVPHKEDGDFSKNENCYRCLINAVGEAEKASLRRLINKSFDVD